MKQHLATLIVCLLVGCLSGASSAAEPPAKAQVTGPAKESALKCFSDWPEGKSPADVGKRIAENFLPRGHYQDHELLRYPDAITWFGALKLARETGDNELAGQLIRRPSCLAGKNIGRHHQNS